MTGRLRNRVGLALAAIDAVLVVVAFFAAYGLRFYLDVGAVWAYPRAPIEPYLQAAPVIALVYLIVLRARGLYEDLPLFGIDVVERTLGAVSLASLAALALSFLLRESQFFYSRSVIGMTWALTAALLPLPRLAILVRRRRRHTLGLDLAPAVIVGAPQGSRELVHRLEDRALFGLELVGIVLPEPASGPAVAAVRAEERVPVGASVGAPELPEAPENDAPSLPAEPPLALPVLGRTKDLARILRERSIREVIVTDELAKLELLSVIATCEEADVEPRVVPAIYDLCITAGDFSDVHGVPFIAIREQRAQRLSLAIKRAFDLVASAVLLVLFAPLFVTVAILIRLGSKGPAFFGQPRVGENGRVFRMWKFRSMVQDAEARLRELVDVEKLAEPVFKLKNDPRVTPIGRFLRRASLDELPQLWNVLKGDMSLVGPRPEEEAVVRRYNLHQMRRLKARPGITGLQQVEARACDSLDERIRLDVLYIRRRTFLFDLWILLRTPRAVIGGKGAR